MSKKRPTSYKHSLYIHGTIPKTTKLYRQRNEISTKRRKINETAGQDHIVTDYLAQEPLIERKDRMLWAMFMMKRLLIATNKTIYKMNVFDSTSFDAENTYLRRIKHYKGTVTCNVNGPYT